MEDVLSQENTEQLLANILGDSESKSEPIHESTEAQLLKLAQDSESEGPESENEQGKVLFRDAKNQRMEGYSLYDEAILSKIIRDKATHEADQRLYHDVSCVY
jgi:hypothetical protein